MKKIKLLVLFLAMFMPMMVNADPVEIDGICYNLISKGNIAEVTQKPGYYYGDIVIPEKVTYQEVDYDVTAIGSNAFRGNEITSIVIPNSVTSIGEFAFADCYYLSTINIPNNLTTINEAVFRMCRNISSITIPNSVTSIGYNAFLDCTGLTSITIPNSVEEIKSSAFCGCENLEHVDLPNNISELKNETFEKCKGLTSIVIPNSVMTIGMLTFSECTSLTSITIPNSVSSISSYAFKGCSGLTSITLGSGFSSIASESFANCTQLTDVYCYAKSVPGAFGAFAGSYIEYATLHVLNSLIDNYKAAITWKDFKSIVKIDFPKHNLTYMVDGAEYKNFEIEEGESITPEAEPTREGYTFSGWSEIPATMPTEDVTITGTFSINKYDLIYKVDGVDYKSYNIDYGTSITPEAAPTREGFTFSGWGEVPATMPAHDVTITGSFTKGTYKLTYVVDEQTYKIINYDYEAAITPEPAPTRDHYTFSGWSEIPATMPANDVNVTGSFSINKYNLIYKVDGEDYKTVQVDYGASITPEPAPTRDHYTFSGWSDIPATMPANDVTITGTFSINKYNLIYKVDGEDYKTVPTEYNSSITPEAAPTKEGHVFSGWSTIPETMPAEDVTVTGTFTKGKYKLTYYFDGNVYQSSDVEYGTTLTPISDPLVGIYYTFSGWSEVPATMPAHDVDVTGTSVPKKYKLEYKVHYSGNLFVYTTYKTLELEYGATITPEPDAAQEGYTFSGWSNIPATMPGYNVEITGLFTAKNYTLTYKLDGETYKSYTVKCGATITPEEAPTIDGFTFNGWVDLPATMPARDVIVTGSMTKKPTTNVTYPAEWDMTNWSEETVANLDADSKWYKSNYRYSYFGSCPKGESIELTANGQLIKETAGVEFAASNCTMLTISTKAGGPYNVNIVIYEPDNFFFVLKNLKRGQKITIDFESVDWYTDNDLFPQPVGAVKMTDRAVTRAQRTESSVADYIVSSDGDVRFNVNVDEFFYLYNIVVTDVSEANLSFLGNPDGINDQIDCYLYWNGNSSSAIGPWGSSYARGANARIVNKSSQTMTITKIVMYEESTKIGTFTDQNGDLAPADFREFAVSVSSSVEMPSTLPWMEVHYTLNGIPYIKKFVSDGTIPPSSGDSDGSDDSSTGIVSYEAERETGSREDIYTLDGRKLSSYPTKKGIYIKNGKKFVVK